MLFASFGEAVQNPDPWQLIMGAVIPVVMAWLSGRFPILLTILKALGVNIAPQPQPAVDPSKPMPPVAPDKLTIADLVRFLLERLAKRKQASQADEDALKAVAEALK
jgi:hypothetical protein